MSDIFVDTIRSRCVFFSVQGNAYDLDGRKMAYDTFVALLDDHNLNMWDREKTLAQIALTVLEVENYFMVTVDEYKTIDAAEWLDDYQILA